MACHIVVQETSLYIKSKIIYKIIVHHISYHWMLLLFYSIICDSLTFKDENTLTMQDVHAEMNEKITNVCLENSLILLN